MISLLAAVLFATPQIGHGAVTGKVEIEPRVCITYPCPPGVKIVTADGTRFNVTGEMLRDIEAFAGKTVTVVGEVDARGSVKPEQFAPGKSDQFIMGKVVSIPTNCPPNALCAPKVGIETADGQVTEIDDVSMAIKLQSVIGAQVMIRGRYDVKELCPMCLGGPMVFVPFKNTNIMVKGNLGHLYHTMIAEFPPREHAKYGLTLPNGGFLPVYTKKNWEGRVDRDVWVSGKFDGEGKFRSSTISYGVIPDPQICFPFGPNGANDGSNVGRNTDTDGGLAAGTSASGYETASAGTKR